MRRVAEEVGGNGWLKWEVVWQGSGEEGVFYLAPISRNAVFLPLSTSSSDQNHDNQRHHNDCAVYDDDNDDDDNKDDDGDED